MCRQYYSTELEGVEDNVAQTCVRGVIFFLWVLSGTFVSAVGILENAVIIMDEAVVGQMAVANSCL